MPARTIAFTSRTLRAILPAAPGQRDTYHDRRTPGLALRVTASGVKTFVLRRRVRGGGSERVTLGRFPDLDVKQARLLAARYRALLIEGKSVNAERKAETAKAATLEQACGAYLNARRLRPNTRAAYRRALDKHLSDWRSKPVTAINRNMVRYRHRALARSSPFAADYAMQVLRAVLNYAAGEYRRADGRSLLDENPTRVLNHDRAWQKRKRRQGCVARHQLADWWRAVGKLAPHYRDYLRVVLLTGLHRREAACLSWSDVDWRRRTIAIPETNSGVPHVLPLSDYLYELLRERQSGTNSRWVFASVTSASGHIEEVKSALGKVRKTFGSRITVHDLRRTFITTAERLDLSVYVLKRLLNHRVENDATNGYVIMEVERLRGPMQKITDFVLREAGVERPD